MKKPWIVLDDEGTVWDQFETEAEALQCIEDDADGRDFSYYHENDR